MLFTADPLFWKALGVTFRFAICALPLGILAGVGLALLLNLKLRGISLFRTIFYLPSIVPIVGTAFIFLWILNPELGLVNGLLRNLGIEGPAWLQDKAWAPWSLVIMSLRSEER